MCVQGWWQWNAPVTDITWPYTAKDLICVRPSMYFPQTVHSSPNLAVQSNQLLTRLYQSIFFFLLKQVFLQPMHAYRFPLSTNTFF